MTGQYGVATVAVVAGGPLFPFRDGTSVGTELVRLDRQCHVKTEFLDEIRVGVTIPTGIGESVGMNGRARVIERNKNMNVTVTFDARRCITVALSTRYPVTASVILLHYVLMTLRAAHLGELVFVRQLVDIGVTIRTREVAVDRLLKALAIYE